MVRNIQVMLVTVLLFVSSHAFSRPLVRAQRFVTLQQGEQYAAVDLSYGTQLTGDEASVFCFGSGFVHDRRSGISLGLGVTDQWEVGLSVAPYLYSSKRPSGFGSFELVTVFGFLPFLGIEASFLTAGADREHFRNGFRVGLPFKFAVIEDKLAVLFRPDVVFLWREGQEDGELLVDAGIIWNLTSFLFTELYIGAEKLLTGNGIDLRFPAWARKGADLKVPVGLAIGATIAKHLDIVGAFSLMDPKDSFESTFTLSVEYRR